MTTSVKQYDVVSYVDAKFLQLFLWKQLRVLSPKSREFKARKPQGVDGVERVRPSQLASRARRCYGIPKEEKKLLSWLISKEGSYRFRPFSYTP